MSLIKHMQCELGQSLDNELVEIDVIRLQIMHELNAAIECLCYVVCQSSERVWWGAMWTFW